MAITFAILKTDYPSPSLESSVNGAQSGGILLVERGERETEGLGEWGAAVPRGAHHALTLGTRRISIFLGEPRLPALQRCQPHPQHQTPHPLRGVL